MRRKLGLVLFFVIAFGVPWIGWFWLRATTSLDHMFDSFATYGFTAAPSLAGFAAAAVDDGVPGLTRFARRVFYVGFPAWIWPLALLLPLLAGAVTFIGHPADLLRGGAPHWMRLVATVSWLNFFTGPLAEEFGWRGYLLDRLRLRFTPIVAGLIIGPIWAVWHLPLFYDSVFSEFRTAFLYLLWVTSLSVVLALVVARARGAVLPSVLGHWAANATPLIFFALLPALPGEAQPGGLAFPIAMAVVAAGLAWLWRGVRWHPYGISTVAPVV